jgi:LmbE family N-acetylglucosaminyl deacetylase
MLISEQAHASGTPSASPAPQPDAAQIQLALRKLGVVGSVLYVAAHPDDENTNLLAYLSKELLLRTGYLSLTRGDGGQNLIGAEQGADLGVIRTQELLAARRIDGAEQFFTRARDFGYSKSAEETLKIWGKDAILADMVWVIRRFRPDVIVTRFSPEVTDTHGHHTASAQLAVEAFHAAADAKFHPEQLSEDVRPWQARRLFWNRSGWSIKEGEDLSAFIKMDVNAYNPLLGISVGELSADSRSMHKSQGFGVARSRSPIAEYFMPLDGSAASEKSFLAGLDLSWKRFRGTATLAKLIERAQREFVPATPYTIIRALLGIDEALDHLGEGEWRAQKKAEVRELVLACAGVFAEATAGDFRVVPGGEIALTASAINRSPAKIVLDELKVAGATFTAAQDAKDAQDAQKSTSIRVNQPLGSVEIKKTLRSQPNLPMTTPYWLALSPEPGVFRIAKADEIGLPVTPASLFVDFILTVDQHMLQVRRPIVYKWTDPVAGELYRSLEVAPAVSVKPATKVLMLPRGEARSVTIRLAAATLPVTGILRVEVPTGWAATPATIPFTFDKVPTLDVSLRVQPPALAPGQPLQSTVDARLRAVADVQGNHLAQGVEHIEHPHIPIQAVLVPSEIHAVALAVEIQGKTIAYIPGPGDEVPSMLQQIGYDVTVLPDELLPHLTATSLARFDAVVLGVRAYNSNDKLPAAQPALMAYVHQGGTIVAQYNTNNRLAPLTIPIGPYPFTIGRERVTDESAPVELLAPEHQLLNWPNKISGADFEGWVQERGLYFASTWDTRYQTILSMRDPGEPTLPGGLLVAREGKGVYIYTGLSFFRQLPAGVPGAFRLFANLLAAGQKAHAR